MENKEFGISKQILKEIIGILASNGKVEKAILYGSRVKGNFSEGSDIDITIIAPAMNFSEYLTILAKIDELDIPQKIDLTKYELLDENVREHIRRVGKEIYPGEDE
ncbi:nucleotidyltransferase domain-containing protein [Thermodesulfovibrio sp.]|uniref:nucleotidyltransferase domain-containing protein n=1 Tax=Thermodesulfovibrio sp. TaxID=2067987 RepID=UPI0030A8BA3F